MKQFTTCKCSELFYMRSVRNHRLLYTCVVLRWTSQLSLGLFLCQKSANAIFLKTYYSFHLANYSTYVASFLVMTSLNGFKI